MAELIVYGASDDLIEIEGDIREEFYSQSNNYLAFSSGHLLRVEYDHDGIWRLTPLAGDWKVDQPGEFNDYSEAARIITDEPVRWMVHGISKAMA